MEKPPEVFKKKLPEPGQVSENKNLDCGEDDFILAWRKRDFGHQQEQVSENKSQMNSENFDAIKDGVLHEMLKILEQVLVGNYNNNKGVTKVFQSPVNLEELLAMIDQEIQSAKSMGLSLDELVQKLSGLPVEFDLSIYDDDKDFCSSFLEKLKKNQYITHETSLGNIVPGISNIIHRLYEERS